MAALGWRPVAGALAIATGISVALGAGFGGSASAQATYETNPRAPEYLYARTCGYCHGHNVGPLIRGRNLSPAIIEYFVRNGNGAMPAFKPTEITNAELAALAQWLSTSEADPREHGQ